MEWWRYAACVDEDPELFFPVGVAGPAAQEQQARAKGVCGRCPVCDECLEYALNMGVSHGVWGGTGEEERRALRRRAQRRGAPPGGGRQGAPPSGGQGSVGSSSGGRRTG
ncbi:WhiB family transcriptional regulator [Streptomyces sp. NBS 14/10]|uniref:WhiB family transcriptional regulator n=1 Tax=Streptomyces sp. NBS 14/10 TaxID=1945643 RepID=UPI000B7F297B|nr:WhiB family transcriptional regulator [Streptomyces sp. NBS 14/10]KAK1184631.1 WhiB family transcriptional regulator [Streptomyces sp. NBS 14/10]